MIKHRIFILSAVALLLQCTVLHAKPEDPYGPASQDDGYEQQPGEIGDDLSDPVALSTGDFQMIETDLVVPGRGFNFELTRMYRSRSGLWSIFSTLIPFEQMSMGENWDHSYAKRVVIEQIGTFGQPWELGYFPGNGRCDTFEENTSLGTPPGMGVNAIYLTRDEYHGVIEFDPDSSTARYVTGDGMIYGFTTVSTSKADGRLASITDRSGNQMLFEDLNATDGIDRIDRVTDTLGNQIAFTYHDDPASPISSSIRKGLLWKVTDHAGRTVEYLYEDNQKQFVRLKSATLPAVVDDPSNGFSLPTEHQRHQNGRTISYEYNTRNSWWWDGQLVKVTSPNGDVILENTYYRPTDIGLDRLDVRLKKQTYGGDTYEYRVTNVDGSAVGEFGAGSYQDDYSVWAQDRNGQVTKLDYRGVASGAHRRLFKKTVYQGSHPTLPGAATDGAVAIDGAYVAALLAAGTPWVEEYAYNGDWTMTSHVRPSDDTENFVYLRDLGETDPRRMGALASKSVTDLSTGTTIRESWKYDFSFSGAGGSCCGSDFATAHVDGKGYVTIRRYDDTLDPLTGRAKGDLLAIYHDLPIGTDPTRTDYSNLAIEASAVEEFTYNDWGQVLTHTHPAAKVRLPNGTYLPSHRRVDSYEYGTSGNDKGRLVAMTRDTAGFALRTEFAYDSIGNVISTEEPDGDVTLTLYNQAHQLVRTRRFDAADTPLITADGMGGSDTFYDANGNVVRVDTLNLLDNFVRDSTNPVITEVRAYDSIDFITESAKEIDEGGSLTLADTDGDGRYLVPSGNAWANEEYFYDGNRNLIETVNVEDRYLEQPDERVRMIYDERDLLVRRILGATSPTDDVGLLVIEYEYDDDKRLSKVTVDPDGMPQATITNHDAFGRLVSTIDPLGNEERLEYDANHNVTVVRRIGEMIDGPGVGVPVLLAYHKFVYDERDRNTEAKTGLFLASDLLLPTATPTSFAVTTSVYNDNSSIQSITVEAGSTHTPSGRSGLTEFFYDTAGRLSLTIDAMSSSVLNTYDDDYNLTGVQITDVAQDGVSPTEVYHLCYDYDGLDRVIESVEGSHVGGPQNTTTFAYDSRGNTIERIDARGTASRQYFDGLSRPVQVETDVPGLGGGDDAIITESTDYDDVNRVVLISDDNGNTTNYTYDGMGREVIRTMPDGTEYDITFNSIGHAVTVEGPRVVVNQVFDLNNRLISRSAVAASGAPALLGSVSETYTYDGLDRMRSAINEHSKVTRDYDSRSFIVSETQNVDAANSFPAASDRTITSVIDTAGNETQLTYPSGPVVTRTFDGLNRVVGVSGQASTHLSHVNIGYSWIGPDRIHKRENTTSGALMTVAYGGYDGHVPSIVDDKGFRSPVSINHADFAKVIDARSFTWDANGNRTRHNDARASFTERQNRLFGYDTANRLISTAFDYPDPSSTFAALTTTYSIDGVQNRVQVTTTGVPSPDDGTDVSGAMIGPYIMEGPNAANNQYSMSPNKVYTYDTDGNMTLSADLPGADRNGDYEFRVGDITDYQNAYILQLGCVCGPNEQEPCNDCTADWSGDGVVAVSDMLDFLAQWSSDSASGPRANDHYEYDYRNRLITVDRRVGSDSNSEVLLAEYRYDCLGRRLVEIVQENTSTNPGYDTYEARQFVYGGEMRWQLLEEYRLDDPNTAAVNESLHIASNVFGPAGPDEIIASSRDLNTDGTHDTELFYHQDDMGTVFAVTDELGVVRERYRYGDYGLPTILAPDGTTVRTESAVGNRFTYTGREWIGSTGLFDYRNRFLDPRIGRFIQRDPMGFIDGTNLYHYVLSNPFRYIDAMGLAARQIWDALENMPDVNDADDLQIITSRGWIDERAEYFPRPPGEFLTAKLDGVQGGLEGAGMIPAVGIGPDCVNCAIHMARGNWSGAMWSGGAAIPGIGLGVTPTKYWGKITSWVGDAYDSVRGFFRAQPPIYGNAAARVASGGVRSANPTGALDTIAEGQRLSVYRLTKPGETFLRYEGGNSAFSRVTSEGGLTPGTFVAPASEGLLPQGALNLRYALPSPEIPRVNVFKVSPPPGTWVNGPRPVVGGTGNEVVFPFGTPAGSVGPVMPVPMR